MLRSLAPLAVLAFLCSLSFGVSGLDRPWGPQENPYTYYYHWGPVQDLSFALAELDFTKVDVAHPVHVSVADLRLPSHAQLWLRGADIEASPKDPSTFGMTNYRRKRGPSEYFATIHLASGAACTLDVGDLQDKRWIERLPQFYDVEKFGLAQFGCVSR